MALNVFAKGKDLLTLSGAFDEEELERVVREIVVEAGEPADAKLYERDPACKIYETLVSVQEVDCTIVEAARATSAASSFFKPVVIQDQTFVDGATAYNNPVEEVLDEAEQIWEARDLQFDKFLSIGTGRPSSKPFGKNLAQIAKTLIEISTDTEKAAERFEKEAVRYKGLTGLYFRFNAQGLEGVGLEDKESFGLITAATNNYLNEHDTMIKLNILSAQNICTSKE
ncbi:hypothetical protein SLS63_003945 [Diaporthe eres]|uniref:PNPLA domain-containing protein n=1 Tax=Diaporthe eres TaxID=83184 RepID=A0ABR1PFT0_DIAER